MPLCVGSANIRRKLVILGDGACGKTSLLNIFTRGYFPTVYEPTVFENYVHDVYIDESRVELDLWDTAGQEEFDRLRALAYENTHTVMLCFSVDSPSSLDNVQTKWLPEVKRNCPQASVVLVALKCDLREETEYKGKDGGGSGDATTGPDKEAASAEIIQYADGLRVAEKIRALRYLGESFLVILLSIISARMLTDDF